MQPENRVTPLNMKIVIPQAPLKDVSCCLGEPANSWFDMKKLPLTKKGDTVSKDLVFSRID